MLHQELIKRVLIQKTIKPYSYKRKGKKVSIKESFNRGYWTNELTDKAKKLLKEGKAKQLFEETKSERAIKMDRLKTSQKVYEEANETWLKATNRSDVKGIDTFSSAAHEEEIDPIKTLESFGGKRWQKGGHDRIYLNDIAKSLGYDWSRYNTGNISSATYEGEHISNSEMNRVLNTFHSAKLYYNISDGKFYWYSGVGIREEDIEEAIDFFKSKIQSKN